MEVAERERRSWQLRWWLKPRKRITSTPGKGSNTHQLTHSQTTTSYHLIPINQLLFTTQLQSRDTQATISTSPHQLFLLADHIKLSLLERQRAVSLNLASNNDGPITRSLESLRAGLETLSAQAEEQGGDAE